MATRPAQRNVGGWLKTAVGLAVGGALFVFASQGLARLMAEVFGDTGRLLSNEESALVGVFGGLVASSVLALFIVGLFGPRGGRRWQFWLAWVLLYIGMGIVAAVANGMDLITFLVLTVSFGLMVGALLTSPLRPSAAKSASKPRRTGSTVQSPVFATSQFGRVPASTISLLSRHVGTARTAVATLPSVPGPVRAATLTLLLDATLRDWWENGNNEGLTATDTNDLKSFVKLAAAAASLPGLALGSPEGQGVYRATLRALMDDWFNNWNSNGVDGPPIRT